MLVAKQAKWQSVLHVQQEDFGEHYFTKWILIVLL